MMSVSLQSACFTMLRLSLYDGLWVNRTFYRNSAHSFNCKTTFLFFSLSFSFPVHEQWKGLETLQQRPFTLTLQNIFCSFNFFFLIQREGLETTQQHPSTRLIKLILDTLKFEANREAAWYLLRGGSMTTMVWLAPTMITLQCSYSVFVYERLRYVETAL